MQRLAIYLHLQELIAGRDVVEIWRGEADVRGEATLFNKGARGVAVVTSGAGRTGLLDASADVVFALDLESGELADAVREARRVLRSDGIVVLGVPSRDRPGAISGASYYDVIDACSGFSRTQMIGLAPFSGTTLVEYGVKDPEPILDGTLVERGERVEHYLAVAGPDRRGDFGYGVVQLPLAETARRAQHGDDATLRSRISKLEAELAEARRAAQPASVAPQRAEPSHDRPLTELRQAIERHAGEMRAREIELAERDAYIAELERDGRRVDELEGRLARADSQRAEAEHKERESRRRIAELEGSAQRAGGTGGVVALVAGTTPVLSDDPAIADLKEKLAKAEAETWKHMKARSEVEAASAELREDTVRKLKDARKLASVELMRALEEASKKAVSLRDELTRSESERKAALAELKALRQAAPVAASVSAPAIEVVDEGTQRRELARAREEGEAAALAARAAATRSLADAESARLAAEASARAAEERAAQLRGRLVALERGLATAERERDDARATIAAEQARVAAFAEHARTNTATSPEALEAVMRDAAERARIEAEGARAREVSLQQLTRLRSELDERERRLTTLETDRPSQKDAERQRAELDGVRARVAKLTLELSRRDAAVERAASVAAHERARSERLVASERQALAERNDARARVAEITAKVSGLEGERERLAASLAIAEEGAHKAENEVTQKRERIKQLKRDLEDAERRAAVSAQRGRALETVRARVQALEAAVAGEASQVADIEATLRGSAG